MKKLINDFLLYLKQKNFSDETIKSYRSDLQKFSDWLSKYETTSPTTLKLRDLRAYVATQGNKKPTTVSRRIACLKSFYGYLYSEELIEKNIAEGLDTPKLPKLELDILTDTAMRGILTECESLAEENNKAYRDYALLTILAFTGLRRAEIVAIKIQDVDFEENRILIQGKGAKQRYVYIGDEVKEILSDYIENFRQIYKPHSSSDYLFISTRTAKLSTAHINNIINKYMELAGCKKDGRSTHALRKKFATTAYKNTGDIYAVGGVLGHGSINTTKKYVQDQQEKIRDACISVKY